LKKKEIRQIVIIGSGQLAAHLAIAFTYVGCEIMQVVGRNPEKTRLLAQKHEADCVFSVDQINRNADLYVLAVSDNAIAEIVTKLPVLNGICVHTSGSMGMEVFNHKFASYGVFYPLQTFTEERNVDFSTIPIFVEANEPTVLTTLRSIARALTNQVYEVDSAERRKLHLAAVMVSNFVNVLLSMGNDILHDINLPFNLLQPLVLETINKAFDSNPGHAQTGPAKRDDKETMQMHLALLKNRPEMADLYSLFSVYIQKINPKNNE